MSETVFVDFRTATGADLEQVLALNEAAVPAVNSLTREKLAWFLEAAPWFRVAEANGEIVGVLIGFYAGSSYASENYQWFSRQYGRFAYVDRVAVRTDARRQRIASRLYDDFITHLPADIPVLTCEVNTLPANPDSMEFHRRRGFVQVGSQRTENNSKEVALLAKTLQ